MKVISGLVCILFFVSCSTKEPIKTVPIAVKETQKEQKKQTITFLSQDIQKYLERFQSNGTKLSQEKYEKNYFAVWNIKESKKTPKELMWAFDAFRYGKSYGENLQLIEKEFFTQMKENANFEHFSSVNKPAISLDELNIRAFPTDKPLLRNPELAGEGFPFDYMQNSTIHANKPLFVTHYSKDKEWVHVLSSFAFGWVKTKDIAFLKPYQKELWQKAEQAVVVKEDVPLYTKEGKFLFKTKLGMMFALIDEDEESYTLLCVGNYKFSEPLFLEVQISKNVVHKGILVFNKENLTNVLPQFLRRKYGWGGMYDDRDCSSTLRDFYAPFGLWLPRNSYQQSKVGEVVSLDKLTNEEKQELIMKKAVPFQTLLYKRGHIVLYTGTVDGKITILQNVWGVKTKENGAEGRYIVGKTIFSTLELGKELSNYDKDASMLKNLKSFNILF